MQFQLNRLLGLFSIALLVFNSSAHAFFQVGAVNVDYVAHASFRITTPEGRRIVIDPYADRYWIGYNYPRGLGADAVLISHAHYDHDGGVSVGRDLSFPTDTPVYREPGRYNIGDAAILGVESQHGGRRPDGTVDRNVIWIVEAGGIRFAHFGDNRDLEDEELAALGAVDILFIGVHDGVLPEVGEEDEFAAYLARVYERLNPRIVIPMLYLQPGLDPEGVGAKWMKTPDQWLTRQPVSRRLECCVSLTKETLPAEREAWMLEHYPGITTGPATTPR